MRMPVPGRCSSVSMFFGDQKAGSRNRNHGSAEHNKRQPGQVAESLARQRQRAARQGGSGELQEQVELFHEEPEGHDGNGGAHPGEERTLIRRMVSEIPDHISRL